MMQGKQAKIVSPTQERAILGYLATTRYPARDQVLFLLSMKAGLRAEEMASLTWAMVTDAAGQVAEVLHVPNRASKGKTGGRTIPLHPDLQAALVILQTCTRGHGHARAAHSLLRAGRGLSPATVRLWFHRLYTSLKMDGCSSHSDAAPLLRVVAYPLAADNVLRLLVSRLQGFHQPVVRSRIRVFSSAFTPPCLLVDMPVPRRLTSSFLAKLLPDLELRPRRHSEQQHLLQAPDMISHARRHRWCPRPPHLG